MSKVREAAIVHFPLLTIKGDFFSDREKTHLRILKGSLQKKRRKKGNFQHLYYNIKHLYSIVQHCTHIMWSTLILGGLQKPRKA